MKELSIEEKAKRYDEAIEKLHEIITMDNNPVTPKEIAEYLFPELKDGEDERIRKAIIEFIKVYKPEWENYSDYSAWIAWLEKQGEQKPTEWAEEDDVRRRSTIQVLEYARSLDAYNQYGKADIDKNIVWLERPYCNIQCKTTITASKEEKVNVQNSVKPADKVEPKFKVGDKVINDGKVCTIKIVNEDNYIVNNGERDIQVHFFLYKRLGTCRANVYLE